MLVPIQEHFGRVKNKRGDELVDLPFINRAMTKMHMLGMRGCKYWYLLSSSILGAVGIRSATPAKISTSFVSVNNPTHRSGK